LSLEGEESKNHRRRNSLSWSHTAASNGRKSFECNGAGGMVVINGTIDIDSKFRYCNLDKGLQFEKRHPNVSISPLVPLQLELSYPRASEEVRVETAFESIGNE
jgi:hypothetical protein